MMIRSGKMAKKVRRCFGCITLKAIKKKCSGTLRMLLTLFVVTDKPGMYFAKRLSHHVSFWTGGSKYERDVTDDQTF
nr:hypothetical protein [Tanacetum cinerariifolium]